MGQLYKVLPALAGGSPACVERQGLPIRPSPESPADSGVPDDPGGAPVSDGTGVPSLIFINLRISDGTAYIIP